MEAEVLRMFARPTTQRTAVLLLLAAVALNSFAKLSSCSDRALLEARSLCRDTGSCCCAATAARLVCRCHGTDKTPASPVVPSDEQRRTYDLVTWTSSPMPRAPVVPLGPRSLRSDSCLSCFPRSAQSLLCVWRI